MTVNLNELAPNPGSHKAAKRVGRGIGCTDGKTCGRGHKGLKARSGGKVRAGFEGGQMPLQKRVPKFGFASRKAPKTAEIRLPELEKVKDDVVSIDTLRATGLIRSTTEYAKVILSGAITKPVKIKGLRVTKGARAAIEAAGGTVEE